MPVVSLNQLVLTYASVSSLGITELYALVSTATAVMKHRAQKQVGKEGAYLAHTSISLFITEGSQDGNSNREATWRQELMSNPWSSAAY